jgi:iron-sulfur cluster assembly accessory protein
MIGVAVGGCKNYKYFIEPVKHAARPNDIKINLDEMDIRICEQSSKYLFGTQVTWISETMGSRFDFNNPNVKEQCCCGKSFVI